MWLRLLGVPGESEEGAVELGGWRTRKREDRTGEEAVGRRARTASSARAGREGVKSGAKPGLFKTETTGKTGDGTTSF